MNQTIPSIAQVLIAAGSSLTDGMAAPLSIGILSDADELFWGDCPSGNIIAEKLVTAERLVDLSLSKLRGQRLSGFRALWDRVRPVFPPDRGRVPVADGVGDAIQQALLAAVSAAQRRTSAELLSTEYNLPELDPDRFGCPLFLEISDFAATAERIDDMLALRPAGIGYRLTGSRIAEALGENAEHLQRFVRELGQRADQLAGDASYQPSVYLGLNGALGHLAGDPIRHIGKVLGNATGLQGAAGLRRLFLEDPFLIETEDPAIQPANMLRLKDFIRRTPSSHDRAEPTQLVAGASDLSLEELIVYTDVQAIHAMRFDPVARDGDIDGLMTQLARLCAAGIGSFVRIDEQVTSRWIETVVAIAIAARSSGLISSYNEGSNTTYQAAVRHVSEVVVRLNRGWPK